MPVYIGHGLGDRDVRPDHAVRAFNQLAAAADRIPRAAVTEIRRNTLPPALHRSIEGPTHFGSTDPRVLFARKSGQATLVLFEGGHDMVFHPGLRWMWDLARADRRGGATVGAAGRPALARDKAPVPGAAPIR